MSGAYARNIYGDVRAVLSAAVDDGLLPRNPCAAKSVRPPAAEQRRVTPWLPTQVHAVRAALPERYRTMVDTGAGCGLRQGEIVGLAEDALDFEGGILRVVRQVKLIRGKAVFAPPKCNKERDVPLPSSVAVALRAHMDVCKPVEITLPWRKPDGPKVSAASCSRTPRAGPCGAATSTSRSGSLRWRWLASFRMPEATVSTSRRASTACTR